MARQFVCDSFPAAAAVYAGGGGSAGKSGTNFLSGAALRPARVGLDSVSLLTPPDTEPLNWDFLIARTDN